MATQIETQIETQSYEAALLDRYYELYDIARELVEQGDVASARRVYAEADKAHPAACGA